MSARAWYVLVLSCGLLGAARLSPAAGQCTSKCSPAQPVPSERWGSLEPRPPIVGDTTFYAFDREPGCNEPLWFDLDVEGGRMFTVTGSTFEVWDVLSNPAWPARRSSICKPVLGIWKKTDQDFYATSVAVPPGSNDLAVVGLEGGMGTVVIDTSNPQAAFVRYQDEGPHGALATIRDVHAAHINGRDYAFAVNSDFKVYVYDLDGIRNTSTLCWETESSRPCSSLVFKGGLNGMDCQGSPPRCSVWMIAGVDQFMLLKWGSQTQLWDVSPRFATPQGTPRLVSQVGPNPLAFEAWKQNGKLYFAVLASEQVRIYEVPCAASGSCAPILVSTLGAAGAVGTAGTNPLRYSEDIGVSYLWVGSTRRDLLAVQREYLYDVTDPAAPVELTPQHHPEGYWGWYYKYRSVAPYAGVVANNFLYRSAWSVLDVHELVGNRPPRASFDLPPPPVYGGDLVSFTDRSIGGPTSWAWDFDGDGITNSGEPHPSWEVPDQGPYPRVYSVTLEVCNDLGCHAATQELTVQDPDAVQITSFRALLFCVSGLCEAEVGQPIDFFHEIVGNPEFFDYDWDGDGTFEDPNHTTPVALHAYERRGHYRPILRVRRPTSEATYVHTNLLIIQPLPLPSFDFESGTFEGWSTVVGAEL